MKATGRGASLTWHFSKERFNELCDQAHCLMDDAGILSKGQYSVIVQRSIVTRFKTAPAEHGAYPLIVSGDPDALRYLMACALQISAADGRAASHLSGSGHPRPFWSLVRRLFRLWPWARKLQALIAGTQPPER